MIWLEAFFEIAAPFLVLILGADFISIMNKMAKYNSCEIKKEKPWWKKVISVVFELLLYVVVFLVVVYDYSMDSGSNVEFSCSNFFMIFLLWGVVRYCVSYERSNTQWWVKFLKFLWGLLFFIVGVAFAMGLKSMARWKYDYHYPNVAFDMMLITVSLIIFFVMYFATKHIIANKNSEKKL